MKRTQSRQSMIGLCLSAILAFVLPAGAQLHYKVIDLGTLPGGTISNAYGVNDHNQVVGVGNGSPAITHAFLWKKSGGMTDLGTLGGNVSSAQAINDAAQIVGQAQTNQGTADAFLMKNGVMLGLSGLGGVSSVANAINFNSATKSFTQIAGWSLTSDNSAHHAVIWDSSLNIQDLGTLGGIDSYALGNNCNGQVVGTSATTGSEQFDHAFVWDAVHGMQDLGTLGGNMAGANSINCYAIIVGESSLPGDAQVDAAMFVNGSMIDLGNLGGSYSAAYAINDPGQVVGWSKTTGDTDMHAWMWTPNTGILDLNNLIPASSGWDLQSANAIANNGKIVGAGLHNGQGRAFMLVPVK